MKTVLRNSYTPKLGDYCETIVVDKESENAYIFDQDGVYTELPQPVDIEAILAEAAEYTDEKVAPLSEKLETIEEGAQVNKIEHVLKNGTELTITNKTVNVTVPTKTSELQNDGSDGTDTYVETAALSDYYTKTETDTQIGYETTAREIADQGLQEQIDAIAASSDVVDIVGTYAALQAYDTSKLHNNDIIKVLTDETRDDATTYYRWSTTTSTWSYIGAEGPFYTKAESDATFVPQTRTVNNKALSSDITLTAADVGALPDSTVIPTVNDATLTIQKNGTNVVTFTANSATNKTANITVPTDTSDLTNGAGFITSAALPTKTSDLTNDGEDGTDTYAEMGDLPTKTSDLTNDGADGTSTYVEMDEIGAAALSNSYTDLDNLPTIPTVNNATLTIQKNGTAIDTFTANASVDKTINVTVPTDTSDLTNNAGFITASVSNLTNYYTKTDTYTQQEVNSLISSITVPTKTSDLTNDGSDGTSTYVEASDLTGYQEKLIAGSNIQIAADGKTISATDTTYSDFTGATASVAGAHGLVPAPAVGDQDKYLKGDGTWGDISGNGGVVYYLLRDTDHKFGIYAESQHTTPVNAYTVWSGVMAGTPTTFVLDEDGLDSHLVKSAVLGDDEVLIIDNFYYNSNDVATSSIWSVGWAFVYTNSNLIDVNAYSYQAKLTAGTNITINGATISASIPIDSALDVSSSNPVENSVVTAAINGKQDALTAGSNISISNNVISATDTTYSNFTGATSSVAGTNGLVPAPAAGDDTKFLSGDGTWKNAASEVATFYFTDNVYGQTAHISIYSDQAKTIAVPASDVVSAYKRGKVILVGSHSSGNSVVYELAEVDETTDSFVYLVAFGRERNQVTWAYSTPSSTTTMSFLRTQMEKRLVAGSNITLSSDVNATTISATDTTYTAGTGINISAQNVISATGGEKVFYLAADVTPSSLEVDDQIAIYSDSARTTLATYSEFRSAIFNDTVLLAATESGNYEVDYFTALPSDDGEQEEDAFWFYILYKDKYDSSEVRVISFYWDESDALGEPTCTGNVELQPKLTAGSNIAINGNTISATDTTYSDFTGATSSVAGTNGLVPAPTTSDPDKYLKGDGTWGTPTDTTYTAGTNVQISAQNVISATDTTYSNFTGATASVAGAAGLVPAPAAGDEGKALLGNGTWGDTTAKLVEMSYGESNAWAKFIAAYNAGSIVYCRASSSSDPSSGSQTRKAFMAYVNNATNPTSVEFQYVRSVSSKTDSQQCDQVFVYTLTNSNGGTWSVASRNMAAKVNVDSSLTKTFSTGANASMTLSANAMTGATGSAAGTAGYVPAPTTSDVDKYLKGDGTWATPTDTTYTAGTNVSISAQNVISATDTTYSAFTGTDGTTAGAAGLVPAPATTDAYRFLSSSGSWESIPDLSALEFFWFNNDLYADTTMLAQVDPNDVEALYAYRPLFIYNPSNTSHESIVSINGGDIINAVVMDYSSGNMVTVQYRYDYGNSVWTRTETPIPNITMTSTDPGEGGSLAEGNFIYVYDAGA